MRKMKQQVLIVLIMGTVISGTISAATNYVVTPGTLGVTPMANYTTWATAATNIQDAIDVVGSGGLVLVTNGTYYLTNEIMIGTAITLRSFNNGAVDRDGTIIDGGYPARSNRCVYVNNVAATINGFTITNGYATSGGGVSLYRDGTLTNCLVRGNRARKGGGVYISGSGATSGNAALLDCDVVQNICICLASGDGGAGIYQYYKSVISDCRVISNTVEVTAGSAYGAGITVGEGGWVDNCLIAYNTNGRYGGGLSQVGRGRIVTNCVIRNNTATYGGGGAFSSDGLLVDCIVASNSTTAAFVQGGTMRNCLFVGNNGPIWSFSGSSTYQNCTVVDQSGVGFNFRNEGHADLENCIVYNNNSGGDNYSGTNAIWMVSCTMPLPSGPFDTGNITNNPVFAAAAAGNYRLTHRSPCVNTGIDQLWMTGAVDLDGNPRLVGIVDMGAYELPPSPGTCIIVR